MSVRSTILQISRPKVCRAKLFFVLGSLFFLQTAYGAPSKQTGLIMEMESDYFGPSTVQVSKEGIRIDSKKLGVVIVSHAPAWGVVAFNEKSKSYYEASLEDWKKRVASHSGIKQVKQEIKQTGTSKVAGQNAKIYRWTDWYTRSGRKKTNPVYTEIYACQSLLVPKQAAAIIASASDLPGDLGLPLRITKGQKGVKSAIVLNTLKCHEGGVLKSVFSQPKGFKRVSSEVALIMEGGDDDMGDLMDGLNSSK